MSVNYLEGAPHQREQRDVWQSIKRGLLCKCPHCGNGHLFRAFAKPVDACSVCAEDFTPQRADDLPAYLVVTIVGHIVLGGFLATEMLTELQGWTHLAIWVPITIALSLALLQPVKGGVIGLQWANYMHGFGADEDSTVPQV